MINNRDIKKNTQITIPQYVLKIENVIYDKIYSLKKKEEKQKMPSKNGQKWSDGNFL